ncbi:MAG: glycosyltransferase family 4 protein, partial [Bacteroidota bacterium]
VPYPIRDGESVAVHALANGLKSHGNRLHLVSLDTDKHPVAQSDLQAFQDSELYLSVHTVSIRTNPTILGGITNLFSSTSYHIRRYDQKKARQELTSILQTLQGVDVVLLESLFVSSYLDIIKQSLPHVTVVYRAHNVEHEIWSRIATYVGGARAAYYRNQAGRLRRYESQVLGNVDLTAAVSTRDQQMLQKLKRKAKILSIPIGIKEVNTPINVKTSQLQVGFIGTLDWLPNLDGMRWFLSKVWPELPTEQFHLFIAGRNADQLQVKAKNVTVLGEVTDSESFLKRCQVSVVPLHAGSGTRVKILESMATGVPVLSTSIGAEGLEVKHDQDILIADDASSWCRHLQSLYFEGPRREQLANKARSYVRTHHNISDLANQLILALPRK